MIHKTDELKQAELRAEPNEHVGYSFVTLLNGDDCRGLSISGSLRLAVITMNAEHTEATQVGSFGPCYYCSESTALVKFSDRNNPPAAA